MSSSRHRMPRESARVSRMLGRCVAALVSILALASTAFGWASVHKAIGGITFSHALEPGAPRSTDGAQNILLIGLDSRKDQHGNELPQEILDKLHAGDSDDGGYNTNTLILMHVEPKPDGKEKIVAFSIPRDDYVKFTGVPGYSHIKIKEAYGLTKADVAQKLVDAGVTDQQELETRGREAGRRATIKAVRDLTGVPIDSFAEVNLAGFYDLAQSLGGVQVCLNHAVYDEYSGADFPAGRQTLDAAQSLAFVRQRHGLDNGDLDRTRRQQAFLISVMHQLDATGTFTDLSKLNALIEVAHKDVVLSAGWDEKQFRRMQALAGGDVEFRTLPVVRYDNINGQDVNIIDPAAIRAEVAKAFGTKDATTTTTTAKPSADTVVDVVNAAGISGLAASASAKLAARGFHTDQARDPQPGDPTVTSVRYGSGAESDARSAAALLGITAEPMLESSLATGHIEIILGPDYSPSGAADTDTATETVEVTPLSTSTSSDEASPPTGMPINGDGIPCVN